MFEGARKHAETPPSFPTDQTLIILPFAARYRRPTIGAILPVRIPLPSHNPEVIHEALNVWQDFHHRRVHLLSRVFKVLFRGDLEPNVQRLLPRDKWRRHGEGEGALVP